MKYSIICVLLCGMVLNVVQTSEAELERGKLHLNVRCLASENPVSYHLYLPPEQPEINRCPVVLHCSCKPDKFRTKHLVFFKLMGWVYVQIPQQVLGTGSGVDYLIRQILDDLPQRCPEAVVDATVLMSEYKSSQFVYAFSAAQAKKVAPEIIGVLMTYGDFFPENHKWSQDIPVAAIMTFGANKPEQAARGLYLLQQQKVHFRRFIAPDILRTGEKGPAFDKKQEQCLQEKVLTVRRALAWTMASGLIRHKKFKKDAADLSAAIFENWDTRIEYFEQNPKKITGTHYCSSEKQLVLLRGDYLDMAIQAFLDFGKGKIPKSLPQSAGHLLERWQVLQEQRQMADMSGRELARALVDPRLTLNKALLKENKQAAKIFVTDKESRSALAAWQAIWKSVFDCEKALCPENIRTLQKASASLVKGIKKYSDSEAAAFARKYASTIISPIKNDIQVAESLYQESLTATK